MEKGAGGVELLYKSMTYVDPEGGFLRGDAVMVDVTPSATKIKFETL